MIEQIRLVNQIVMDILYILLDPLLAGLVFYCVLSINRLKKEVARLNNQLNQVHND